MSKIDLKFASIKVKDGYPLSTLGNPGKVDLVAGYAAAATTMVVDDFTGQVVIGDTFMMQGDTDSVYTVSGVTITDIAGAVDNGPGYTTTTTTMTVKNFVGKLQVGQKFKLLTNSTVYTISAHTETTGNTTSITFSPGLVDAAVDSDVLHIQNPWTIGLTFTPGLVSGATDNDTITIQPHSLDVKIGEGTLTYDEKRKMEYILDRGRLSTVRLGDEEPMDVKLDFLWEFLTAIGGSGIPTIEDAFKKRGEAATWITSSTDPCEPYSLDIVILYEPDCTGIDPEEIILNDFRWESLAHDFKQGSVAVTGKCNNLVATASRIS